MSSDWVSFDLQQTRSKQVENFPATVLIVDDDVFNCHLLEEQLKNEGYACIVVNSGGDALRVADECQPDLILLDAMMPVMSGFEVVATLKAAERTRNIPVIMITALDDQKSRLKALECGAEEFLTKPVHHVELVMRVRNLLKIKKYQDRLELESDTYREKAAEKSTMLKAASTRLDELQGQLLQSEKLASIGQLAAGVAHEINNPIGFVNSNFNTMHGYIEQFLEALRRYEAIEPLLPADALKTLQDFKKEAELDYLKEDIGQLLKESQDGIARVRKIVQDLKDFSRTDRQQTWEYADVHRCLDSTLTIVNNEIKYKADVVREYGNLPEIECLPSQLNQVFLNLLVNAAQAMDDKTRGQILVRTGRDADNVWVEVADSGSGIAPDDLKRIFEPFYTTKPQGLGTGLGLSVSYGIVSQHGGRIEVSSVVGQGTTMRVVLPIHRKVEQSAATGAGNEAG